MTNTRAFLPELTRTATGDALAPLSAEHRERRELLARLWAYYRGEHRRPIRGRPNQPDDNVIVNWSKKIVNQSTAFLFGEMPTFQIDDGDDRNPAEMWLDTLWRDNPVTGWSPHVFLKGLGKNGAVCGAAFIRMYVNNGRLRLVNVDPMSVDVLTDDDDIEQVTAYHIVWRIGGTLSGSWKRHRVERVGDDAWDIAAETWQRSRWIEEGTERWPYPFPPMMHCQNLIAPNAVWGISDLEDADLNDAINFVASNTNRIVRYHAHPRTIGIGFTPANMQAAGVDNFWTVPAGSEVFNLEMQSDLSSTQSHRIALEEAYHQVTDTPRLDPASVNLGALSGFALQILYAPLLQKTADKRGTYGGLLRRVNRAALLIGGHGEPKVDIIWKSPLPGDTRERAEIFARLTSNPEVDIYAAAIVAGYTADEAEMLAVNSRPESAPIAP